MTKSEKLFRYLVISLFLLPLLNCAQRHDDKEKYYLVSTNIQVPYWQAAGAGFMQAATQMKVKAWFVGPDKYDPQAQQQEFQKAVRAKAAGILVSPADPALMKGDIDAAIAAGIPVITIDSDSPDSKRLTFIGTNNYQAGIMGGKVAVSQMHGKGNVVVFSMPNQSNLEERLHGYRDAFADSQIKIVRVVDIKGDPVVAFDTATQIVGKERNKVDGFVCLEALAGKEVASVLDRYNVKGKTVVAMDTDPDTLNWIKKGTIAATIAQKPFSMSYVGLRMLDELFHNKLPSLDTNWRQDPFSPVPAFVDTGSTLIDKNNVDTFVAAQKSASGK